MADEAHSTGGDTASEDAHPSQHGSRDGRDGPDIDYFGLTDDEQRTLRPARLAKVAATHLSLRDLTAEVHRLSRQDTVDLTRRLSKNANAPAADIAQALRAALGKITEEPACRALHDALHYGVLATALTAQLQERELAALLTADPTYLNFLAEYALRDTLAAGAEEFGVSAQARTAVWSSMICSGHEGAVAALGWLVADPPEFWNDSQRQAVTKAWTQVRVRLPQLPEQPTSLANLCDVIAGLERTGALEAMTGNADATGDTASTGDGSVTADEPTAAEVDELSPANVETLTASVTDFQAKYHNVRSGALSEVNVAMAAGRVPPRDALRAMEAFATDMESLLQGIADATGSPIADTLEQALEDLDTAATAHTTAVVLDRIGRLTSLRAPDYVAAEAAQIADMAASVDADTDPAQLAALDALVAAIDLSGSDPQQFTELVRIVQTGLPSAAVLVMLASNGLLSISDTALADITTPAARSERPGDGTADGGPAKSSADPAAPKPQSTGRIGVFSGVST